MSDGFETMVDTAQGFFAELSANNRKDWFEPRKTQYNDDIRKPGELFADLLAEDISRLTGVSHTPKLFRIYRDVRFSKDKSPYKPWLHMLWRPADADDLAPIWFFSCAPGELLLGMGVVSLKGAALTRYRVWVDTWGDLAAEAMAEVTAATGAGLSTFGAPPLQRVPKPYPPDHPHAELLKRKGLAMMAPLPDTWRDRGLVGATNDRAKAMMPLWHAFHDHL
ncbi:DUF2461 domain-containing protein [Rhodophyticola sp. CCM32]|uniref:DUF2461 domain-containing protein n=1 Tax=Rhodophyticola sp. CCM32 TaxID=2916397 RepID=UPI00143D671A|nr:DUF2461 domain-containing protein [Rhodophyticola sp. CCM32]